MRSWVRHLSFHGPRAFAAYRERECGYETDAFPASEAPVGRSYELVVALSRPGTTTEDLDFVREVRRHGRTSVLVVTATASSQLVELATHSVVLDFADEVAVVQTRFATSAFLLLLSGCGWDVKASSDRVQQVLAGGPPVALSLHYPASSEYSLCSSLFAGASSER